MSTRTDTSRRPFSVTQVLGELLLTVGVVVLLFAFYESYWTNIAAGGCRTRRPRPWRPLG